MASRAQSAIVSSAYVLVLLAAASAARLTEKCECHGFVLVSREGLDVINVTKYDCKTTVSNCTYYCHSY